MAFSYNQYIAHQMTPSECPLVLKAQHAWKQFPLSPQSLAAFTLLNCTTAPLHSHQVRYLTVALDSPCPSPVLSYSLHNVPHICQSLSPQLSLPIGAALFLFSEPLGPSPKWPPCL